MGKSEDKAYSEGYNQGHSEGLAGKPCSYGGNMFLDIINTADQQAYENGLQQGYVDGQTEREE